MCAGISFHPVTVIGQRIINDNGQNIRPLARSTARPQVRD
jgi:hypothetical protein